ncbi:MAG: TonB-dependent receptor [Balneola sp.]
MKHRFNIKRTSFFFFLILITPFLLNGKAYEESFFFGANVEPLPHVNGSVEGRVVEAGTDEPLIGASVYIKGTTKGTATDIDGEFKINNVAEGEYIIVISYLGYNTLEVPVVLGLNEDFKLNVELEWQGVTGEEVTITAQARGQVAAINEQIKSNNIVNIVSKDRIEDVPDVNAAESIGRLPGVSIQRSNGEANKVVIRGLSPKFNAVSINGVRIPSTGNDRSASLSLISSNMLDGIEVSKAITPDMDGDALGGSVNLRLRRAPEKFFGDFRLQTGYTEVQDEYGNYLMAASAGRRFLNNKIGVIASLNLDDLDRSADVFDAANENRQDPKRNNEFFPYLNRVTLTERERDRQRLGFSLITDYKLPKGDILISTIYNRLTTDGFTRTSSYNISNIDQQYTGAQNHNIQSILSISVNLEQDLGWLKFDSGVSYSSTVNENPGTFGANFRQFPAANALLLNDDLRFGDPRNVPSGFEPDSSRTELQNVFYTESINKGEEITLSTNFTIPYEISNKITGSFKFGGKLRYIDRSNDVERIERSMLFGGGTEPRAIFADALPEINFPPSTDTYTLDLFQDSYTRSNFLNRDYPLGYTFRLDLIERGFRELQKYSGLYLDYNVDTTFGDDYTGEETYGAAYIMTTLNLGDKITLIPGVRYEKESSTYTGNIIRTLERFEEIDEDFNRFLTDTTSSRENDFLLPMVHLRIDPVDWLNIRLAYTESITRPNFLQYAPLTYIDPLGNFVNAPNTRLNSSSARNYDASVSVYQSKLGLLTASYFYKEIEGLIRFVRFPWLNGQTILPDLNKEDLGIPISGAPQVNTNINNPEIATVEGVELDWQTNFWYLPSIFKGLVFSMNYTILTSETQYPINLLERVPSNTPPFFAEVLTDTVYVGRIPDQPSNIGNITIGYDYKGFSVRLSYYYQNDVFTGGFGSQFFSDGQFIEIDDLFTDSIKRYDLTLKQTFKRNYEIYANLNNLTNEDDRNFYRTIGQFPVDLEYYGFTMDVGFRMKF